MMRFWRSPLYVLVCATAIILIVNGTRQNFGLFLVPLSTDLGWGREEFSIATAIQNLTLGLAAPFVGGIADKWGPIRVIAIAGTVYALGLLLISVSGTPELMILTAGVVVGLGSVEI